MLSRTIAIAIATSLTTVSGAAIAQRPTFLIPRPDSTGNYYSITRNDGKIHDSWIVTTPGLNCRRNPQINSPIVQDFSKGALLDVDGDKTLYPIQQDSQGLPWLRVESNNRRSRCFIRANSQYVAPYTSAQKPVVQLPRADRNGDFTSIRATYADGSVGFHAPWLVVDPDPNGLNCRNGPGTDNRIIRRFPNNELVTADASSRAIAPDNRGKPWLRVKIGNSACFVRAHSNFVKPFNESYSAWR